VSEYPYGISDELSADERAQLEATVVPLGFGRTRTAADLVVGWAAHVTRLHAEHGLMPAREDDVWTAQDYVAALIIRDLTERALGQLEPGLRERAGAVVARFDELLRSFTEHDERGLVRRLAGGDASPQWWWDRLPVSGPVRADLDALS
jgi:hypothetical protein